MSVLVVIEGKEFLIEGDSKEFPQASQLVDAFGFLSHDWYLL